MGDVYFEPVCPHIIYQALAYLKSHNEFYKIYFYHKGSFKLRHSGFLILILEITEKMRVLQKKLVWNGKEMRENMNDTESETEYASVEDPLKKHKTASNETTLISEIPNIINEENVITASGQEKIPVLILSDDFHREQAFCYILPKGKFGQHCICLSDATLHDNFFQKFILSKAV